jgi:hypothetical protein
MKGVTRFLRKLPVQTFLLIPALLYLTVAVYWHARGIYLITGDEPHYLLIADSIVRDQDLRVENNYQIDTPVQREVKLLKLYVPERMFVHVYNQFSLHNVGLPLLLFPSYLLAGVFGTKIFMALLAGLWPLLFYRILLQVTESKKWSVIVAFALGVGLPFSAASSQIYPDLIGGMIVLYVAWKIFGRLYGKERRAVSLPTLLWAGALTAFLPWLHVRLLAPAAVLLVALVYTEAKDPQPQKGARVPRYLIPAAIFAISFLLLSIYNHAAFGNIFGPYEKGSLSFDLKPFLMIFLGLHWDQAQGMFMQQPLLLLGLVGIVPLVKANWRVSLWLGVLYLSLIMPNSMHPAWYGGFSFTGRFGWGAIALWLFPLAFAVKFLLDRNRLLLGLLCLGSVLLQGWLAAKWFATDGFLINQGFNFWTYRGFYNDTGLLFLLPSFKDLGAYLQHPANYIFTAAGMLLIISGWLWQRGANRLTGRVWAVFSVVGVAILLLAPVSPGVLAFPASVLPSNIGTTDGPMRVATAESGAGALMFGPYVRLLAGLYEVNVEYESTGTSAPVVGRFDVIYNPGVRLVGEADLPSSETNNGKFKYRFHVRDTQSLTSDFEFRVWYPGQGTLRVKSLTVTPVSFDQ